MDHIKSGESDFIFVDLDDCNAAGHGYEFDGYVNKNSNAIIIEMDKQVGHLLNMVITSENSKGVKYLIILTTPTMEEMGALTALTTRKTAASDPSLLRAAFPTMWPLEQCLLRTLDCKWMCFRLSCIFWDV